MKLSPAAAGDKPEVDLRSGDTPGLDLPSGDTPGLDLPSGDTPELDLDTFVPFQLSVTANAVSELIASAYRSLFGLRVAEWRVLAIVAQSPGIGSAGVARRAELDTVTVSRAVAALLGRGLVAVGDDPGDRRAHRLTLTAAGRGLYRSVVPAALALEARVVGCLSSVEAAQLTALLARVRKAAQVAAAAAIDGDG